ncbi:MULTISPECIES: dihydroneopterin aldolase [unclassified Janthinobacterium]|uniref:dihydroneopterin aldolase n=1 Tax=unclassified Janthinobacterium TaxID=2610881 RepID=UPI00034B6459|nr:MULTISPECIES: dihydroneopterin aldolase [unclassified Janthinobacterium]MEC5162076.1 FolB domain-containing protein [Janthinobacterium sp. CG_S6]
MRNLPWTINVSDLHTRLRVGIWEHEREFQPIIVNLSLRALVPAAPRGIEDCLDYQPICHWISDKWPTWPHTPLLETRMRELMEFVFHYDARIEWADVSISKPNAIAGSRGVGVRLALSRADFEAAFGPVHGTGSVCSCAAQLLKTKGKEPGLDLQV